MRTHIEIDDAVGIEHLLQCVGHLEKHLIRVGDMYRHLFDVTFGIQRLVLEARTQDQ